MPLHIDPDLGTIEREPLRPYPLAHQANRLAASAADARESLEALRKRIGREMEQPFHQKLFGAGQGRRIPMYGLLAVAFLACVYWEWITSREIYAIWVTPWVPFIGCVGFALYASACLGESTTHFSLFLLDDGRTAADLHSEEAKKAAGQIYDVPPKPRTATNWYLHPATGVAIALLFLFGIYIASHERIKLLKAAGELPPNADFQIWLPVILYGAEILMGMPAFFCLVWACRWACMRRLETEHTRARRDDQTLRQAAIENYANYLAEVEESNGRARENGRPLALLVPPSQALRALLAEEWGYDPTSGDDPRFPPNGHFPTNPNGSEPPSTEPPSAPEGASVEANDSAGSQEEGQSSREKDLLNLLDEQIENQNRGL